MPELILSKEQQDQAAARPAVLSHAMPSAPTAAFDNVQTAPPPHEEFYHPVKAIEDIIAAVNKLSGKMDLLLNQMLKERTFVDTPFPIGATIGYTADYHERKYIYAYALSGTPTLVLSTGGTVALTAGSWKNISPPRGATITLQGGSDSAPTVVLFRACDVIMN